MTGHLPCAVGGRANPVRLRSPKHGRRGGRFRHRGKISSVPDGGLRTVPFRGGAAVVCPLASQAGSYVSAPMQRGTSLWVAGETGDAYVRAGLSRAAAIAPIVEVVRATFVPHLSPLAVRDVVAMADDLLHMSFDDRPERVDFESAVGVAHRRATPGSANGGRGR